MNEHVTSTRFPYLSLHVEIPTETRVFEFHIESLVDTGFDGGLTVPKNLIPNTIAPFGQSNWKLADETEIATSAYFGYVSINGLPSVATLIIALGNDCLLGRNITNNFRLTFDHGIKVIVQT